MNSTMVEIDVLEIPSDQRKMPLAYKCRNIQVA